MSSAEMLAQAAEGPALIGIFLNAMLYGAMITQTFFYFSTYKTDPTWIRIYVTVLFVADSLNAAFNLAWIYGVLINNFGNEEALGVGNWLFQTEEAMTGIISMQVQLFYAWRLYKLTGSKLIVAAVVMTSLLGGLSGIGTAVGVGMVREFAKLQKLKIIVSLWLIGSAVCDVIITIALTWHLRSHRTGFSRTDTLITKITQLIVSNGLLTAIFAVADIVAFLATNKSYHLIFNFPLSKLYGNSAMSSLNARSILMNSSSKSSPSYQGDTPARVAIGGTGGVVGSVATKGIGQIMVNVETHEMADVVGKPIDDVEWQKSSTGSDTKAMAL
ncbi:uncharacterized protein B0H18DRAFT_549193 [Fomitopsis serialis]|uniref:uncharacterized protein n=1 Tax=Fomitopsis serialis TaxID=139415 RepID=UPI002007CB3E|nr:uncharacterized protein B0H18DRAFT_549193 [Neoantrodia serialis]KAH9934259.1 hypothetical protein B0H18DRAFT_549193 [Neoantrodia serialis]